MALIDQVQARLSAQRLKELTNPDERSATSIDTTRLELACMDTQAQFQTLVGREYDDTDAQHVAVAMLGVIFYLNTWRGIDYEALRQFEERWEKACEALRKVTFNNRVRPTTNSQLQPSSETDGATGPVRPDFDREHFGDVRPAPPQRGLGYWHPDSRT